MRAGGALPAAAAVALSAAVLLQPGQPGPRDGVSAETPSLAASVRTGLRASIARQEEGRPDTAGTAADTVAAPVVLTRGWPVMGTLLEVTAVAPDTLRARAALSAGRREVFRLDSLLSTYRPESEVSRLNTAAGTGRWTGLSPGTARALAEALRWAERTRGAVDPTVGPLVDVWGFRGREPTVPEQATLDSARRLVGWRKVEVREGTAEARLPRAGMRLDFGAVGKGMALDRAVAAMREAGASGGMADLGGQVSVFGRPQGARGREPRPREAGVPSETGGDGRWLLGLRHPRADGRLLGTLSPDSGSVATSGDAEQFFERDGVRYSHIMDARTGRPARGVAQVTTVARDGSTADALATALFVLGPDRGREWLRENDRVGRGRGQLSLALWVRDPGGGPICPRHVVRVGPDSGKVGLRFDADCPGSEEP